MKTFLIILAFSTTFLGCSYNNAFDRFKISTERELSEENIQTSIITKDEKVNGTVTAIYLNKIYPELYNNAEYFYIYLHEDQGTQKIEFILNGLPSLLVEELEGDNPYIKLTQSDVKWQKYYLVGFAKSTESLNLKVQDNNSSSAILKFKKN